jgi:hypothetical protein
MDGQKRFAGTHFVLAIRDSRLHTVMEREVVLIIHLFIYSVRLYFSANPACVFPDATCTEKFQMLKELDCGWTLCPNLRA